MKRKKGDVAKRKWKLNHQQNTGGHTSNIRVGKYSQAGLRGERKDMSLEILPKFLGSFDLFEP